MPKRPPPDKDGKPPGDEDLDFRPIDIKPKPKPRYPPDPAKPPLPPNWNPRPDGLDPLQPGDLIPIDEDRLIHRPEDPIEPEPPTPYELPEFLAPVFPEDYDGQGPENAEPGIKPWTSLDVKHRDKPKAIAFYWEFWAPTICGNHSWRISTPEFGYVTCPPLPYQATTVDLDIIDGVLHWHTHQGVGGTSARLEWSEALSGETGPNIGNLLIKCTVDYEILYASSRLYLRIEDDSANWVQLYFISMPNITWTSQIVFIGDNGGDPMLLQLADYGLSGRVRRLYFYSVHNASRQDLDIDYLTFPPIEA